jgi:hypothetical protein
MAQGQISGEVQNEVLAKAAFLFILRVIIILFLCHIQTGSQRSVMATHFYVYFC